MNLMNLAKQTLFSQQVLFSHFRPLDGTLEKMFLFKCRPMQVHSRAYVCILQEQTKDKFPREHHVAIVIIGKNKYAS